MPATPTRRGAQKSPAGKESKTVLVIDVGGTHIKFIHSGSNERVKIASGPGFTPRRLVSAVRKHLADWDYDCISIGLPTPIVNGRPIREPQNLGRGWMKFDFEKALGKPCRTINDAAMQALGSYLGGRMLFLGLGTGLGAALVLDDVLVPLELSELAYDKKHTYEDMLGRRGRKRLGQRQWEKVLHEIAGRLHLAFVTDYIVIGGGNAKRVKEMPEGARCGDNRFAFVGGLRLWGIWPKRKGAKKQAIVIR